MMNTYLMTVVAKQHMKLWDWAARNQILKKNKKIKQIKSKNN